LYSAWVVVGKGKPEDWLSAVTFVYGDLTQKDVFVWLFIRRCDFAG
jgi:hypothetical protein